MKMLKPFAMTLLLAASVQVLAEDAPDSVKQLAEELRTWGEDPVLVAAVKEQNGKGVSLDSIKANDEKWRATSGLDDFMKSLMSNAAAQKLMELEKSAPFYSEIFLMDDQGANVAMTNKTSDYWQGDEAKFTESFKGGQGGLHIGKVEFDESSQAYLVQVSTPVVDGGKAIGAITIGVNVDELEAK